MIITLEGDPIVKKRPKITRYGTFDPQAKLKEFTRKQISRKFNEVKNHPCHEISQEAINLASASFFDVEIIACLKPPCGANWPKRNAMLWNLIDNPSNKDLDNIAKFYLDCANGILYPDDRFIMSLKIKKITSDQPKVIFMCKARKSLTEEVQGILGIFSRNEMKMLLQDLEELYLLFDVSPEDDWLEDEVGSEDVRGVRLSRAALLLSKLSIHADKLKKIKRNFGGFNQRCLAALNPE